MDKMKTDGLIPLAFGDFDGWPAMGTFDILNMRLNGYQFHIDLLAGKEKWTDPRVKAVFEAWKKLLPYYSDGGSWPEVAGCGRPRSSRARPACTSWARSQAQTAKGTDAEGDIAFFPFPTMGTAFDAEMAIDAPIDGMLLSKAPKNLEGAKALMQCFSTGAAQHGLSRRSTRATWRLPRTWTPAPTPTSRRQSAAVIAASGADRPVPRPRHDPGLRRVATGMQPQLQSFIGNPDPGPRCLSPGHPGPLGRDRRGAVTADQALPA